MEPILAPIRQIERTIFLIHGEKVMLDADLAHVYGVTLKRLREQVRRNRDRFPEDFVFLLTKKELLELAAKCGELANLKFSRSLPYAFTEHGAIMLASILNSKVAVQASIHVVRAFVRLREMVIENKELGRKLAALEQRYDYQFKTVFDAIRQLMEPPPSKNRKIGFV